MKKRLYLIFAFLTAVHSYSQNTVGTISNEIGSYNGYTLFTPNHSGNTYLINNCGEIVNQWTSTHTPGNAVYLLENGNLLRTGKITNSFISIGGIGGKIELFDWDNNLLWEYTYSSEFVSQHHDVFPLPNGNILMLALSIMSKAEVIQAGRDPFKISDDQLYNEHIIELEPFGTNQANIVWEWHIKDHLIQDFNNSKDNFGVIADNPQLLDINYLTDDIGKNNWIHANSMQYNATLDQIILSSRLLSEFYIIDHSTTTAEAASHTGGTYGKGGDFLYRWGNPEVYDHGDNSDRQLWGQHYPHWIAEGLTDAGKILIYNNGQARGLSNDESFSSLDIITPPETAPGSYNYDVVNGYGPTSVEWSYTKPVKEDFYSHILSSGQRLPNGNTLICVGFWGEFFEIDSSNNIVWEYINPDAIDGIQTQGELATGLGAVFRALKYSTDYPAFTGRDLTPNKTIELGDDLGSCAILNTENSELVSVNIYPNPVSNILNINTTKVIDKIQVYNILGEVVKEFKNTVSLNLSNLKQGLYIIQFQIDNTIYNEKIIKK